MTDSCTVEGGGTRLVAFCRRKSEGRDPACYVLTIVDTLNDISLQATLDEAAAAHLAEVLSAAVKRVA